MAEIQSPEGKLEAERQAQIQADIHAHEQAIADKIRADEQAIRDQGSSGHRGIIPLK